MLPTGQGRISFLHSWKMMRVPHAHALGEWWSLSGSNR